MIEESHTFASWYGSVLTKSANEHPWLSVTTAINRSNTHEPQAAASEANPLTILSIDCQYFKSNPIAEPVELLLQVCREPTVILAGDFYDIADMVVSVAAESRCVS